MSPLLPKTISSLLSDSSLDFFSKRRRLVPRRLVTCSTFSHLSEHLCLHILQVHERVRPAVSWSITGSIQSKTSHLLARQTRSAYGAPIYSDDSGPPQSALPG